MPTLITVVCPFHFDEEQITLPSKYSDDFDGEVPCGKSETNLLLNIKLRAGNVIGVRRAKNGDRYDNTSKKLLDELRKLGQRETKRTS